MPQSLECLVPHSPRASLNLKEMAKISAPVWILASIALRHIERGLVTTVTELSEKISWHSIQIISSPKETKTKYEFFHPRYKHEDCQRSLDRRFDVAPLHEPPFTDVAGYLDTFCSLTMRQLFLLKAPALTEH